MRNTVSLVAKVHGLPEADLVDFALAHDHKYGIDVVNGNATVGNWHSEQLIADFERQQAEDAAIMAHPMAQTFDAGCEYDLKAA